MPGSNLKLSGLEVDQMPLDTGMRHDLILNLREHNDELNPFWLYNTDLFNSETIVGMHENFKELLVKIIENPVRSIDDLGDFQNKTYRYRQRRKKYFLHPADRRFQHQKVKREK